MMIGMAHHTLEPRLHCKRNGIFPRPLSWLFELFDIGGELQSISQMDMLIE